MNPRTLWQAATAEHRSWLFLNAIVIAAVINAALNALIAWGSAAGEENIPLLAVPFIEGPSTITDTVGTFFILTFLTTLGITTAVWQEVRKGKLLPLAHPIARLPRTRLRRGAYLGAICTLVLGPPAVLVLALLDFGDLSVGQFVLYKAIFGVVLGALVTPPIALFALADGKTGVAPAREAHPQNMGPASPDA